MLVSAIIPNYNYASYLPERIESILNQTYKKIEIIIIDDASVDNSREIIDSYKEKHPDKINTIYFETNSGCTYQRWNDGAAHAHGDYILFAGADDYCDKNMIHILVQGLEQHLNCGVAYCDSWVVDKNGKRKRRFSEKRHMVPEHCTSIFNTQILINSFLTHETSIPNASGALIRRSLFNKISGFDTKYTLAADVLLWINLSYFSDILYIHEPLNFYRKHDVSVSTKNRAKKKIPEFYNVCTRIMLDYPKNPFLTKARNRFARKWANTLVSFSSGINGFTLQDHITFYKAAKIFDKLIIPRLLLFIIFYGYNHLLKQED